MACRRPNESDPPASTCRVGGQCPHRHRDPQRRRERPADRERAGAGPGRRARLEGAGSDAPADQPDAPGEGTAEIVAEAIGLEPSILPYVHELDAGETFEDALGRVRRLKAELESAPPDQSWLVVSHGIFIRFFLFDSLLGSAFVAPMAAGTWNIGSRNCGVSLFSHGEAVDPWGNSVPGWACHQWMERPWDPA